MEEARTTDSIGASTSAPLTVNTGNWTTNLRRYCRQGPPGAHELDDVVDMPQILASGSLMIGVPPSDEPEPGAPHHPPWW